MKGTMAKLKALKNQPHLQSSLQFIKIHGVGPSTAKELAKKGFKNIDDLRKRGLGELTPIQRIGLSRFEDLQERIPRSEATVSSCISYSLIVILFIPMFWRPVSIRFYLVLSNSVCLCVSIFNCLRISLIFSIFPPFLPPLPAISKEILNAVKREADIMVPGSECIVGGSYRRGKESCGDVDVLIFPPIGQEHVAIISAIHHQLKEKGFLTDDLTMSTESDSFEGGKVCFVLWSSGL